MLSSSPIKSISFFTNPSISSRLKPVSPISDQSHHRSLLSSNSTAQFHLPNLEGFPQSMNLSASPSSVAVPITSNSEFNDSTSQTLVVIFFYKFAYFPDHADLRQPLKKLCEQLRVSGGIILAPEGINGSICGTRESVDRVLGFIQSDDRLRGLRQVESPVCPEEEAIHHGHSSSSPLAAGEDAPFRWDHVRVKFKKEIVTLGMPSVSPIERVGK